MGPLQLMYVSEIIRCTSISWVSTRSPTLGYKNNIPFLHAFTSPDLCLMMSKLQRNSIGYIDQRSRSFTRLRQGLTHTHVLLPPAPKYSPQGTTHSRPIKRRKLGRRETRVGTQLRAKGPNPSKALKTPQITNRRFCYSTYLCAYPDSNESPSALQRETQAGEDKRQEPHIPHKVLDQGVIVENVLYSTR